MRNWGIYPLKLSWLNLRLAQGIMQNYITLLKTLV